MELYDKIARNGYQLIYLTARSMGDDQDTREYLFQVKWDFSRLKTINIYF